MNLKRYTAAFLAFLLAASALLSCCTGISPSLLHQAVLRYLFPSVYQNLFRQNQRIL